MELGPILRSLWHHKTRFWLISLEIALTLAVVINCAVYILDQRREMQRPTGMDEDHILVVHTAPISSDFEDDDFVDQVREADLRMLQARPGVRAAASFHQIPLSGGGSATGRKAEGSELDTITAPYFLVTEDAIATLGVQLEAGRDFTAADYVDSDEEDEDGIQRGNVILTQALADKLYPDGDALGRNIQNGDGTSLQTVVGIIRQMHGSWPSSEVAEDVMLYPIAPGNAARMRYLVRSEPGRLDEVSRGLEEALLAANPDRIVTLETLAEVKADYYGDNVAMGRLFGGIIVLMFIVTSLGLVGLTSFSVTERTRQIGTRRALGASRWAVLRYFLVENWVITGLGLTLGVALAYGLNFLLVSMADAPTLEAHVLLAGVGVFWLVGLLAVLAPAARAMRVPPVLATRTI